MSLVTQYQAPIMNCHSKRRIKKNYGFGNSGKRLVTSSISLGTIDSCGDTETKGS